MPPQHDGHVDCYWLKSSVTANINNFTPGEFEIG